MVSANGPGAARRAVDRAFDLDRVLDAFGLDPEPQGATEL